MENLLLSRALTDRSFSIVPAAIATLVVAVLIAGVGFYLRFIWALHREMARSRMPRSRKFWARKPFSRVSCRGNHVLTGSPEWLQNVSDSEDSIDIRMPNE